MKCICLAGIFAAAVSLTGCATSQRLTVAEPVGAGEPEAKATGSLKIYTATEQQEVGEDTYYYPHTGYVIYNERGEKVMYVENHVGIMDESPSIARLPAGAYVAVAEADGCGRVRIPLVISANRTTVIHLDGDWKPPQNAQSSDLVRLPDGEAIGWKAQ